MPEIPEKLVSHILHGVISGIAAVALFFAWRFISRRHAEWPVPAPALFIALAFLVGEALRSQVPWFVWPGFLILCISGKIKDKIGSLILIATGAALLSFWCIQDWWIRGAVVLLALWLSKSFSSASGLLYLLLPLSMAGIVTTVPDTEQAGFLFGTLVPTILFARHSRSQSSKRIGFAALAGIVAWVICCSGQGRPASIVVSVGCLAILVGYPFLNVLTRVAFKWLAVVPVILHCVSIAIALGLARITPDLDRAIIAAFAALLIPGIVVFFLSARKVV